MRTYLARYTLRNGVAGVLTLIAHSSCGAILIALDTFGEQLRTCSARPGFGLTSPLHHGRADARTPAPEVTA